MLPLRAIDYACSFFPSSGDEFLKPDHNFGPVHVELAQGALPVRGQLPADLNGEYVRNGPNNKHAFSGQYHWFDGDGMLHGVLLQNGTASYVNRWVRTRKLALEEQVGVGFNARTVGTLVGSGVPGVLGLAKFAFFEVGRRLGLVPQLPPLEGTANTALVFHHHRLYALVENAAPYAVRLLQDGVMQTLGAESYDGRLKHAFTAHPKIDPVTGEMRFFGYHLATAPPYVLYSVVDKDGALVHTFDPRIAHPSMMHDFAITERFSILMDLPLRFDPRGALAGRPMLSFRPDQPSRFAVFDRRCADAAAVRWFTAPACYVFHTANAWEHGKKVSLLAIRYAHMDLTAFSRRDGRRVAEAMPGLLCRWTFDLDDGSTGETCVCDVPGEFPVINPAYVGRPCRFVYYATVARDATSVLFDGVIKVDVVDGKVAGLINYGGQRYGGECIFVPRQNAAAEDDGYLLTFVHDISKPDGHSEMWVMDARSMAAAPLAVVSLPARVPFGFHGIFVSAEDMARQRP